MIALRCETCSFRIDGERRVVRLCPLIRKAGLQTLPTLDARGAVSLFNQVMRSTFRHSAKSANLVIELLDAVTNDGGLRLNIVCPMVCRAMMREWLCYKWNGVNAARELPYSQHSRGERGDGLRYVQHISTSLV